MYPINHYIPSTYFLEYDGASDEPVSSSAQVTPLTPTTSGEQTTGISSSNIGSTGPTIAIASSMMENADKSPGPLLQHEVSLPSSLIENPLIDIANFPGASPTRSAPPHFPGASQGRLVTPLAGKSPKTYEAIGPAVKPPSEALPGSSQSSKSQSSQPAFRSLDEEEPVNSRGQHPPPQGMATLPRCPPTVPVESIFQA